jgi:hypothetical protein
MSGMLSDSKLAKAIVETLTTPDEQGKGTKPRDANLVDGLYAIALAIEGLAGAIERLTAKPGREVVKLSRR